MKRALLALFISLALSSPLLAQGADKCIEGETVDDCFARIEKAVIPSATEAAVTKVMAEANTGVPTLTSPLGSAVADFLSRFAASADSSMLSRGNDGSLTLDMNLGAEKYMTGRPLKVEAVFHAPVLNPKVKVGLPGNLVQDNEKSLNELDDVSLSLTYSPQNRSIGRTLSPHRALFQLLVRSVPSNPDAQKLLDLLESLQSRFKDQNGNPLAEVPAFGSPQMGDQRADVERAVIAAAKEQVALDASDKATLKANGVDDFRKLLDEQPQAYASVVQRSRNELIGPNERSFKLTYETSGFSLRNFYSAAASTCNESQLASTQTNPESQQAVTCLDAWKAFVKDEKTQRALTMSGRFSFSVEYSGVDANKVEIALPSPAAPFKLATGSTESLIGSLTYGQVLVAAAEGIREGRIDLKASYENVTGAKNRDNRFVISAVYSQKLTDTMSLPFGIVYANHEKDPAFKDTNRQLSMHFGLVFKLPEFGALMGAK